VSATYNTVGLAKKKFCGLKLTFIEQINGKDESWPGPRLLVALDWIQVKIPDISAQWFRASSVF
jgi:hypothetical protein